MSFREKVSKLEDVKDGDTIKAEHKNELNRTLRELAKAVDTRDRNLKVEGDLEVSRALKLGWDLLMARKIEGDENYKRALVVLNNPDRLIMNFDNDFKGGVEIMGSPVLIGNSDWSRLKVEQPKSDRYDIYTGEGGKNAPKHIHISATERSVIEFNNSDIWINEGNLRVENHLIVGENILLGGRTCPICGKEIVSGYYIVFRVELALDENLTGKKFYRLIPIHANCVSRVKLEDDIEKVAENILSRLTLRSYPSKKKLYPIDMFSHTAFGKPGVTIRFGFIDDESMRNNTEMLVKIERYDKYFVTVYACGWWGAEIEWDGRKICDIVPQEGKAMPICLILDDSFDLIKVTTADGKNGHVNITSSNDYSIA